MEQDRGLAGSISAPPAYAPTCPRCLCPLRATQAPPPPAPPLARPSGPRPAALSLLSSLPARGQGWRPGVTLTNWEMEDTGTESNSANGQSPALRPQGAREPGSGASRSPVYPGTTPLPPGPFLPRGRGESPGPGPGGGRKGEEKRRHAEPGPRPEPRGPGTPTCWSCRCFRCTPATVAAVSSTERPNTTLERLDIPLACLPADRGLRSQRPRPGAAAAAAAECASPPGAGPGAMPRAQSPVAARRGESSAERRPYFAGERDFWRGLGGCGGNPRDQIISLPCGLEKGPLPRAPAQSWPRHHHPGRSLEA